MKLLKWVSGRQGSGYRTMFFIYSKLLKLDCCIINIKEGIGIPPHKDVCPVGGRMYRFNFEIKKPKKGGNFVGNTLWRFGRMYYFRPDIEEHQVTTVEDGELLIFSICKVW
jgi:hypothetical protein